MKLVASTAGLSRMERNISPPMPRVFTVPVRVEHKSSRDEVVVYVTVPGWGRGDETPDVVLKQITTEIIRRINDVK